jgi:hypothetical protein
MLNSLERYQVFLAANAALNAGVLNRASIVFREQVGNSTGPAASYSEPPITQVVSFTGSAARSFESLTTQVVWCELTANATAGIGTLVPGRQTILMRIESSSQDRAAGEAQAAASISFDEQELATLFRLLRASAEQLRDSDIAEAIRELSKLLSSGKLQTVDAILNAIQPTELSVEMMITLLRTSYVARTSLQSWATFLERARAEVTRRGRNPAKVFRGLSAG